MTQSKHTDGPWRISKSVPTSVINDKGYVIASCSVSFGPPTLTQERLANARLIAAAPDMLEALKETLRWAESMAHAYGSRDERVISQAQKAINKAKGIEE